MSAISKIESLLFVSSDPISFSDIRKACDLKKQETQDALAKIKEKYKKENGCGMIFVEAGDKYQFVSNPDNSKLVKDFLKSDISGDLTDPAIETLSIIAYRGPVTKPEIEQIRGINCSLILRNLLIRGLIEKYEDKKINLPRYSVTHDFIKFLGISSVCELPDYEVLSNSETLDQVLRSTDENKDQHVSDLSSTEDFSAEIKI